MGGKPELKALGQLLSPMARCVATPALLRSPDAAAWSKTLLCVVGTGAQWRPFNRHALRLPTQSPWPYCQIESLPKRYLRGSLY